MAEKGSNGATVANSREQRDKAVAHLAGLSRGALMAELATWTVRAQDLAEESRELRRERGEARGMLELIATELRSRQAVTASGGEGAAA